ncbi:hypothetical protein ACFPOI_51865 [Nonomuraea angiospora]|uniref:Uncharacterized protein n=1 Tax=Nonomuraea angiospora TaxID=46172 RepID=A0ABR9M2C2_9ACTN|nr:hypothetical protein [Nonomuraea angiospora]MBE1586750.1 hypothetical protein [Nonomuraea angiospora]
MEAVKATAAKLLKHPKDMDKLRDVNRGLTDGQRLQAIDDINDAIEDLNGTINMVSRMKPKPPSEAAGDDVNPDTQSAGAA